MARMTRWSVTDESVDFLMCDTGFPLASELINKAEESSQSQGETHGLKLKPLMAAQTLLQGLLQIPKLCLAGNDLLSGSCLLSKPLRPEL